MGSGGQNSSKSFANSLEGIWRGMRRRRSSDAVRLRSLQTGGPAPRTPRDICGQMKGARRAEA